MGDRPIRDLRVGHATHAAMPNTRVGTQSIFYINKAEAAISSSCCSRRLQLAWMASHQRARQLAGLEQPGVNAAGRRQLWCSSMRAVVTVRQLLLEGPKVLVLLPDPAAAGGVGAISATFRGCNPGHHLSLSPFRSLGRACSLARTLARGTPRASWGRRPARTAARRLTHPQNSWQLSMPVLAYLSHVSLMPCLRGSSTS